MMAGAELRGEREGLKEVASPHARVIILIVMKAVTQKRQSAYLTEEAVGARVVF